MHINRSGGTRIVLITNKYVIKFPRFNSWKSFVQGMLSNMTEGQWKGYDNPHLCPITYSDRLGLLVVMRRAKPVQHTGLFWVELEKILVEESTLDRDFFEYDATPKNFGYLGGRLVKIDYGV